MTHATAIIIGAGHAGLVMSRALTRRSIDHIMLDRGDAGHAWRAERWESLRMLTPNWANRLPGETLSTPDPDGFMHASEFAERLRNYALAISAPLQRGVTVRRVAIGQRGYLVETDQGAFSAEVVVNATGATSRAHIPAIARDVPPSTLQITPDRYRRPADLPPGAALVVGASASGVQLAQEIQRSGRQVFLAVGNHVRLPRRYRGRDIEYWLHMSGILDERASEIEDLARARRAPSPQLIGGGTVDLNALRAIGVEIVGRLSAIRDGTALFSGGLANVAAAADLKMRRTLNRIDDWIATNARGPQPPETAWPQPTAIPESPRLTLGLAHGAVRTVVWATGFRPDHSWLDLPVFDRRGAFRHDGGVSASPGLVTLGLPILRRRRSHQISGAAADTQDLSHFIAQHLTARRAA